MPFSLSLNITLSLVFLSLLKLIDMERGAIELEFSFLGTSGNLTMSLARIFSL